MTAPASTRRKSNPGGKNPKAAEKLTARELTDLEKELQRELKRLGPEVDDASATSLDRARRAQLRDAIQRIRDGIYGICDRCAEPIPFGRLLVMPEATHCVTCSGWLRGG